MKGLSLAAWKALDELKAAGIEGVIPKHATGFNELVNLENAERQRAPDLFQWAAMQAVANDAE